MMATSSYDGVREEVERGTEQGGVAAVYMRVSCDSARLPSFPKNISGEMQAHRDRRSIEIGRREGVELLALDAICTAQTHKHIVRSTPLAPPSTSVPTRSTASSPQFDHT